MVSWFNLRAMSWSRSRGRQPRINLKGILSLSPDSMGTCGSSNCLPWGPFLLILCICIKKNVSDHSGQWVGTGDVDAGWGQRDSLGEKLREDFCKEPLVNNLYFWNSILALGVSWVFRSCWTTPPSQPIQHLLAFQDKLRPPQDPR